MKQLARFDEDGALGLGQDGQVANNRGAQGPITLTIEDGLPAGTEFEVHVVEPYPVTVTGLSAGDNLLGQGQSITLTEQGKAVRLVLTGPHTWTGA